MKVQAHTPLAPPLEYLGQMPLKIKVHYDVFNHLGSYINIMQFQISSRKKTGKEIPESSKIYSACTNEKSDLYELWQQHKLLQWGIYMLIPT